MPPGGAAESRMCRHAWSPADQASRRTDERTPSYLSDGVRSVAGLRLIVPASRVEPGVLGAKVRGIVLVLPLAGIHATSL